MRVQAIATLPRSDKLLRKFVADQMRSGVLVKFSSLIGNSQKLDGGAMFGNAPKALWSRWIEPDAENRIPLACRALLVEDLEGKTVLFEAGIGAFFSPDLKDRYGIVESEHVLLSSLAELGLSDADIDVVVLSHLHFDHAGGLLAAWKAGEPPRLLFPKARFLVGAEHWRRALDPHPRDRRSFIPELHDLLESSGRLELVKADEPHSLGESVRFHFSEGHTPGLMLAEVASKLIFCGDLIPGRSWVHSPITMGYDRYPELLIDEKERVLDHCIARGVKLFFTHDHACAMASPKKDAAGRYSSTDPQPSLSRASLVA